MKEALNLSNRAPIFLGLLGYIYGKSGMTEQAEELIMELTTRSSKEYVASFCFVAIYAGLSNRDEIFKWLKKTDEEGLNPVTFWATVKSDLDSLRFDPRFADLLQQMNLQPKGAARASD